MFVTCAPRDPISADPVIEENVCAEATFVNAKDMTVTTAADIANVAMRLPYLWKYSRVAYSIDFIRCYKLGKIGKCY